MKIIKKLSTLALALSLVITVTACSKSAETDTNLIVDNELTVDQNKDTQQQEGTTDSTEENDEIETLPETGKVVGRVGVYNPVDFKTVTDFNSKFEELKELREEYDRVMRRAWALRAVLTKEEVSAAVYNIVRIDNDIASILAKLTEQKRTNVKNEDVETQIEMLESHLKEIKEFKSKMTSSENVWSNNIKDVGKADADKIIKVKKYNNLALIAPIRDLESDLTILRIELESMKSTEV